MESEWDWNNVVSCCRRYYSYCTLLDFDNNNSKDTHSKTRYDIKKGKIHPITGHEGPEGEQICSFTLSLTSVLGRDGWLAPRSAASPRRKKPGTHFTGGWLGPRNCLDGCGRSRPQQDCNPGPSSPQQATIPTELSITGDNVTIIKYSSQRMLGNIVMWLQYINSIQQTGCYGDWREVCKVKFNTKLCLLRDIMQIYGQAEEAKDRNQILCFVNNVTIIKYSSQRMLGKIVMCLLYINSIQQTGCYGDWRAVCKMKFNTKLCLIRNIIQIYGQAEEAKDRNQILCFVNNVMNSQVP